MDFSLNEQQHAIRSVAADIFRPSSAASAGYRAPHGDDDGFDHRAWARMAKGNLLGVCVSEPFGGSGFSILELCPILEEQGKHLIRIPAATSLVAAHAIDEFGPRSLRESLLARVVAGDCILSTALVEAGAHDPCDIGTSAEIRTGGGWVMRGEKICVPYADLAERILTPVRMPDSKIAVVAVDPSWTGVEVAPQRATHGEPMHHLRLDNVMIGDDDIVGTTAEHREQAFQWVLERSTVAMCAVQLGVVEQILSLITAHTSQRRQFGQPLGAFQGVALRVADAYLAVECLRDSVQRAAWRLSAGRDAAQAVRLAKYWAAESGHMLATTGQHLHGGIGMDTEYPLHRYTLWSKYHELILGSAHVMLAAVGRHLAGLTTADIDRDL